MPLIELFRSEPFKTCTMCQKAWTTREDFMSDRSLIYKGYIADFEKLEEGLFLFLHDNEECYTTMAVKVGLFFDLYRGDRFTTRMHNSAECGGYCLNRESIALCPVKCECAFVRDIITTINTRRR